MQKIVRSRQSPALSPLSPAELLASGGSPTLPLPPPNIWYPIYDPEPNPWRPIVAPVGGLVIYG